MAQDQPDAFYYLHWLGALHSFSFRQPETNMAAHQPVVIDLDEDIVIARPGTPARYQNEHQGVHRRLCRPFLWHWRPVSALSAPLYKKTRAGSTVVRFA